MRNGIKARLAVAQSDAYKEQVKQLVIAQMDAIGNDYDELLEAERQVIKAWRDYRTKNGMSNDAIPTVD